MNTEQLLLQIGVSGALIWAVVKLGLKFIERWATAETERTKVLADSLGDIAASVSGVHVTSSRMEGKLDAALRMTPARGVPIVRPGTNNGER
jgi:hypothetical protein